MPTFLIAIHIEIFFRLKNNIYIYVSLLNQELEWAEKLSFAIQHCSCRIFGALWVVLLR